MPADVRRRASRLEQWLFHWEAEHARPRPDHMPGWSEPHELFSDPVMWVIPRSQPFAMTAIEHHWNADLPFALAIMQRWHRRWGAELVGHFGTMLNVRVARQPDAPEDTWQLAREVAHLSDFLPAVTSLRHAAHGLAQTRRWTVHSRP